MKFTLTFLAVLCTVLFVGVTCNSLAIAHPYAAVQCDNQRHQQHCSRVVRKLDCRRKQCSGNDLCEWPIHCSRQRALSGCRFDHCRHRCGFHHSGCGECADSGSHSCETTVDHPRLTIFLLPTQNRRVSCILTRLQISEGKVPRHHDS